MDRTGFNLGFDLYTKVIQRDVNNYILIDEDGNLKRKGGVVKKLSKLDNDLPIVNKAVVDYFTKNIPVEKTILECDEFIMFQKITKISSKYEYGFLENFKNGTPHNFITVKGEVKTYIGEVVNGKVQRCFASKDMNDGILYKKKKDKTTLDKTAGTPEHCFVYNDNIENMKVPAKLDKQWYIDLANERIDKFI